MIDVNGLKRVNDVFGHQAGDQMIIEVAQVLMKICRKTDVVTRLGGDEFIVLCPGISQKQATILIERIREEEAQTVLICEHPDGTKEEVPVRMSIGMADSSEAPPNEVLKEADARMYRDKEIYYETAERYR